MADSHFETERKYIIEYPDLDFISSIPGCRISNIVQTYLVSEPGTTSRVRCRTDERGTVYIYTSKKRVSPLTQIEKERDLSAAEYRELLTTADHRCAPVEKTRYAFPYGVLVYEIDVYPFWSDFAVLETELKCEEQQVTFPPFITVRREVTGMDEYSNKSIARRIKNGTVS